MKCSKCSYFVNQKCELQKPKITPRRACTIAIIRKEIKKIKAGDEVLEIGFGVNKQIRKSVRKIAHANWTGIDPRKARANPKTKQIGASVNSVPFENEHFDWIFSSNTMEHWKPKLVSKGISEIFRVLKPGGVFVTIVPISHHGYAIFKLGKLKKILRYFYQHEWEIKTNKWAYEQHKIDNKRGWILEIVAKKSTQ